MSKHTPGNWHWDSDPIKNDPLGRVRYRVTTVGKTITQCYYSSSDPHAEADARLIAAAPELLMAVQYLLMGEYKDSPAVRERRAIARAAIAKATGEQA